MAAPTHELIRIYADVLPKKLTPHLIGLNVLRSHQTDASVRAETVAWLRFLRRRDETSTDRAAMQAILGESPDDEELELLDRLKRRLLFAPAP
jgi:hypothetical protein